VLSILISIHSSFNTQALCRYPVNYNKNESFIMSSNNGKDINRVAGGLKAAINNPNVSEEAKIEAQNKLDNISATGEKQEALQTNDEHVNRVLGGYKATVHNSRVSAEARQHAQEVLEAAGYQIDEAVASDEHDKRVLAGYKAALNNPRVSEAAKAHAREYISQYGS
jgi:hypothetical protein